MIPEADLAILDPVCTAATVTRGHAFLILGTLYACDAHDNLRPQMIAGHTQDGTGWTLIPRQGPRFHDSTPRHVVASIERWARPGFSSRPYAASVAAWYCGGPPDGARAGANRHPPGSPRHDDRSPGRPVRATTAALPYQPTPAGSREAHLPTSGAPPRKSANPTIGIEPIGCFHQITCCP